uniref:(northern house mosquito) hypothetical protein n=1 Tax=Culex pipiens TaxID=7175 RepID=A0A8D8F605_CULPI
MLSSRLRWFHCPRSRCTCRPTSETTPTSTRRFITPPTWELCSAARKTPSCQTGSTFPWGITAGPARWSYPERQSVVPSAKPCPLTEPIQPLDRAGCLTSSSKWPSSSEDHRRNSAIGSPWTKPPSVSSGSSS